MLQITSIKNVAIENITFTPNTLVLLKQRERATNSGEIETTVQYIEVCELSDTKELNVIQSLLRTCLAEFRVSRNFEKEYKETEIKQRRIVSPFLNTNIVFRTDSKGKISRAIISEIPFSKTALNIRENHTICKCEPGNLKAAIYQHSKAVLAQCTYISTIGVEIAGIIAACNDESTKITKKATKSEPKATAAVAAA